MMVKLAAMPADAQHLKRISALLEAEVRKAPEQYLWAHRRFKTRPDGMASAYADEILKERHRR